MRALFRTKAVADIVSDLESGTQGPALRRSLGAFDLVMLGIGAVIGAGIFSAIGTAAVGEVASDGTVVRYGAGPALVVSFLLLGAVCALAGLCYAELTALIPIAGSAYTYAYATLGEVVAWIIGWDLILEYAVGNVAVAIAWSGYFTSFLRFFGIPFPFWLAHSYRNVALSFPDRLGELPVLFGHHLAINVPGMVIVALITWVLVIGVRESAWVNNAMVALKLAVLALFVGVGIFYLDPRNWAPFAPNGWRGIHQGAAIVFFAYIGFDAVSTAAEETKDPQKNMPRGILGSLVICTLIYAVVGLVATGLVPYAQLKGSDPLARAFEVAGIGWGQAIISFGAIVSMSAVLLVFQLGQPRIFFSMSRDGLLPPAFRAVHPVYRTPHVTTMVTGVVVALGATLLDDNETYDLTNIGTLFAFLIVCLGVLALRLRDPQRPRPFRVPLVWLVAPLGAVSCLYVMTGLPRAAWVRFGVWLLVGAALYFAYGHRHSRLRQREEARAL
ncbi:MAG TPA: amino acid permease [Vicinamibacteria bacterium]|nr:amino acid permease [Vicinamibacteria bacterium]